MAEYIIDSPALGFKAAGAISRYVAIKVDSNGRGAVAGATDPWIGIAKNATFAQDDDLTVMLVGYPLIGRSAAAITIGQFLVRAANGKFTPSATSGTTATGYVAGESVSGADQAVTIYPCVWQ